LHGFSSSCFGLHFRIHIALFRMCNAYAEIGLFVLMYLLGSRCRIPTDFPVWPTYELLHFLYFSSYMSLEFYLIE